MIVQSFDVTQKALLDNSWLSSEAQVLFSLVSDSYSVNTSSANIFSISPFMVGSPVSVTGRTAISTADGVTLNCDKILLDGGDAAYGLIYTNNTPLFIVTLNNGELLTCDGTQDISFNSLLSVSVDTNANQSMLTSVYASMFHVLYRYPFNDAACFYSAQLLSSAYTFDSAHTTRENIKSAIVGTPVQLQNASISNTTIDCDDIDFTGQGTLDAAAMVILKMKDTTPRDTDELILHVDFSNGDTKSLDRAVPIQSTGLISFSGSV